MIATSPSLPVSANPVYAPGSAPAFDGGGFLPNSLPNLQLWLDADSGPTITESGNKVSQWNDKSGNGNNALQGTGADQPTFVTNHINGKAVLTFNGIVEEMDLTSDLSLTGEFTMFIVANNEDTASTRVIFGHDTDNNKIATLNPAKAFVRIIAATAGDSSQDYLDENSTGIQIIQRNSSDKIDMAFNGAAFTRLFSDVAQSGTSSWNRLGVGEGTSSWKGYIAEIIIYNRSLSTVERASVEIYLSNKWNISISAPDNIGGLQLWLDANDSSTITESGGQISQWDDKSGNGNHSTQDIGVDQPTTGIATLNGKNGIRFAIEDHMDSNAIFATGGYTAFFVLRINTAIGDGGGFPRFMVTPNDNQALFIRKDSGDFEIKSIAVGANDPRPSFDWETVYPVGTPAIITTTVQLDSLQAYANGVQKFDTARSATASSLATDTTVEIGKPDFAGDMFEVLLYDRILSNIELNIVNQYLSNKWGIAI